jgi:hypothetical protein
MAHNPAIANREEWPRQRQQLQKASTRPSEDSRVHLPLSLRDRGRWLGAAREFSLETPSCARTWDGMRRREYLVFRTRLSLALTS